jgi:hypothetical protein
MTGYPDLSPRKGAFRGRADKREARCDGPMKGIARGAWVGTLIRAEIRYRWPPLERSGWRGSGDERVAPDDEMHGAIGRRPNQNE